MGLEAKWDPFFQKVPKSHQNRGPFAPLYCMKLVNQFENNKIQDVHNIIRVHLGPRNARKIMDDDVKKAVDKMIHTIHYTL